MLFEASANIKLRRRVGAGFRTSLSLDHVTPELGRVFQWFLSCTVVADAQLICYVYCARPLAEPRGACTSWPVTATSRDGGGGAHWDACAHCIAVSSARECSALVFVRMHVAVVRSDVVLSWLQRA